MSLHRCTPPLTLGAVGRLLMLLAAVLHLVTSDSGAASTEATSFDKRPWKAQSLLPVLLRSVQDAIPDDFTAGRVKEGVTRFLSALWRDDESFEYTSAHSTLAPSPKVQQEIRPKRRLDADERTRRRELQAATPNASACSGIGVFIPDAPTAAAVPNATSTTFTCNGYPVSQASYLTLTTAQGEAAGNGINPLTTVALIFALAGEGQNVTKTLIRGEDPLPPSINVTRLPIGLQAPIVAAAGTDNITIKGELFPFPAVAGNAGQIGTLLNSIGPLGTADLIDGTQCLATIVVLPSASPSPSPAPGTGQATPGVCACPLDRSGDQCQYARHFQCVVALADPVYHACVAANGEAFVPPHDDNTAFGSASPGSLGASGLDSGMADQGVYPGDDHAPVLGPGSGVAVPVDGEAALSAGGFFGYPNARSLPRPTPRLQAHAHAYRTEVHGDPPCLYLNVSHVRKQVQEAVAAGRPSLLPLRFRVKCGWLNRNMTVLGSPGGTNVGATTVLADPGAVLYAGTVQQPYGTTADVLQEHATGGQSYSFSGPVVQPVDTAGIEVVRCNGTVLTPATLATALRARGYTAANASAAGPWPYYGLPCVEAAFLSSYVVGPPSRDQASGLGQGQTAASTDHHPAPLTSASGLPGSTFSLAAGRAVPLALRVRALHPTFLSDARGLTLAPIPWAALHGGQDVPAYLDLTALLNMDRLSRAVPAGPGKAVTTDGQPLTPAIASSWWPAGRLYLEAKVVMAPEGVANADCGGTGDAGYYGAAAATACTPLSDVTTRQAFGAASSTPAGRRNTALGSYDYASLLLLSNVHRLHIEDVSYVEPTGVSKWRAALALGLGLGIPLLLLTLCMWGLYRSWKRRRAAKAKDVRNVVLDAAVASQIAAGPAPTAAGRRPSASGAAGQQGRDSAGQIAQAGGAAPAAEGDGLASGAPAVREKVD